MSTDLKPGDVIKIKPQQCRIVKIDRLGGTFIVEDLLGHQTAMAYEMVEDWWEKVGDA